MHIKVLFFASLRERVGLSETLVEVPEETRVARLWSLAAPEEPLPANVLAAKNMEYVELDAVVGEGDEIAFFPPVTGGCQ